MNNLVYVGVDIHDYPNVAVKMDLAAAPIRAETFDAIICIHILEHIEHDRQALRELHRILKPGGWAAVSVPIRWEKKTYEDPKVVSGAEREREFGETAHVRYYGYDFVERLEECGFQVEPDLGKNIDQQTRDKYGLRDDEDIFLCRKAPIARLSTLS